MWPFGRRRPEQAEAELPAELAEIGDETALRLSIVLRDGDEINAARDEIIASCTCNELLVCDGGRGAGSRSGRREGSECRGRLLARYH
jgi:hypothetical protein